MKKFSDGYGVCKDIVSYFLGISKERVTKIASNIEALSKVSNEYLKYSSE